MGDEDDDTHGPSGPGSQRLDKWLWYARIMKSRTLAASAVADGRVRVNKLKVSKPAHLVKAGDVLTIALRGQVLVLRLLLPGQRRGPASEAQTLYTDLTPARPPLEASHGSAVRDAGSGRPSKRDRRLIDRLKHGH